MVPARSSAISASIAVMTRPSITHHQNQQNEEWQEA
jgi:hypothetical protein